MADFDGLTPGQVLEEANVAEFIKQLGLGIAEAQRALDENSVDQIAEFITPREGLGGRSLLDIGLSPAFYHYQHADISVSLQVSLRVQRDTSLGLSLSGSFSDTTTSDETRSESESETETGSSVRTETREARVAFTAATSGTLTVGGRPYELSGTTPMERVRALRQALTEDADSGVGRSFAEFEPQSFTITTDANDPPPDPAPRRVEIGTNTVTFLGTRFDSGIIEIDADADTTFTLNGDADVSVSATERGGLEAFAEHAAEQIRAENYTVHVSGPDAPVLSAFFGTGDDELRTGSGEQADRNAGMDDRIATLAQLMRERDIEIDIEGFADAQPFRPNDLAGSVAQNNELGDRRARALRRRLVAEGIPESRIHRRDSRGHADAAEAGGPADNIRYRRASVFVRGRTAWWLAVHANSGGPRLTEVAPDRLSGGGSGNAFILLFRQTPLGLGDRQVTVEGEEFSLSGAAGGGQASGTPAAHAHNLAAAINGRDGLAFTAHAEGPVTTILGREQPVSLILQTAESREITLSGTSSITVTQTFTRTRTRELTRQNTGNRAVAVGASLDVRHSRQFEANVTGNATISARLVSIPAPPQFLETIRGELGQGDGT